MSTVIGKFCSVAKKDEIVKPRDIPGYTTPKGQAITADAQQLTFTYDPISYTIAHNLNNGSFAEEDKSRLKETYTIEDSAAYIPPSPTRYGYRFSGWTPSSIQPGSYGEVTFEANWVENVTTVTGAKISEKIDELCDRTSVMSIERSTTPPAGVKTVEIQNGEDASSIIYLWYSGTALYFYCKEDIWANTDMRWAFVGMTMLRDISGLEYWMTSEGMSIDEMFDGCTLLSDLSPIENWANGVFDSISYAFKGTAAASANRVPDWYKWDVTVLEVSSTGLNILTETRSCTPGETIYPRLVNGYAIVNHSLNVDNPSTEYTFTYKPLEYKITYNIGTGADLATTAKTTYTIEDEDYTPPNPVRSGYTFKSWSPEKITKGSYGNVTFFASYEAETTEEGES
jgi:hypothetical protein